MNSVILILDGHCIETAARKRLSELIKKSIEEDVKDDLFEEIEFLKRFIEGTDFSSLRANNPELDGRKFVRVEIICNIDGGYSIINLDAP
ncbi:MAG: hypothetical protein ACPL7I_02755 [Myxococcota bacterium]